VDGTEVLVVPDAVGLRKRCIEECHDAPFAGHAGMHKTFKLLQRTYWWPAMRTDVERFGARVCPANATRPPINSRLGCCNLFLSPGGGGKW
jgi:hypothetical protein